MSSSRSVDAKSRNRKKRTSTLSAWVWILVSCIAVLIATYMMFVEPPPPRKIVIASGGRNGAYYHFAQKYSEDLKKQGLSVEVRETQGSVENLKLLNEENSGVDVAIVQSGVANAQNVQELAALGSLYREPLWIFYRAPQKIGRLGDLEGKRIGVGPTGSGTHTVAMQLIDANGLTNSSEEKSKVTLVAEKVDAAAKALQSGELDAAFFVAAFDAEYIQELLHDPRVSLLSFDQREAYHRRFRFMSPVTLPAGLVDLGKNIPDQDIALLAPTAEMIVRKGFHPALVPLLLTTAIRIHGKGDELSNPGEFPSTSYCDFPLSDEASHFYRTGPPVLQRLLPFWLASLIDRAKVMLIPIIMLMMPLLRAAPPLMRWRTRRKIYLWYSDLREIDQKLVMGLSNAELDNELARMQEIEYQVACVDVPLSYMEEFYHLRMHSAMLQEHLRALRGRN